MDKDLDLNSGPNLPVSNESFDVSGGALGDASASDLHRGYSLASDPDMGPEIEMYCPGIDAYWDFPSFAHKGR
jgi:hypothetical protein